MFRSESFDTTLQDCDAPADYPKTDRGRDGAADVTATCLWAGQVSTAQRVSSVIQKTHQDVNWFNKYETLMSKCHRSISVDTQDKTERRSSCLLLGFQNNFMWYRRRGFLRTPLVTFSLLLAWESLGRENLCRAGRSFEADWGGEGIKRRISTWRRNHFQDLKIMTKTLQSFTSRWPKLFYRKTRGYQVKSGRVVLPSALCWS